MVQVYVTRIEEQLQKEEYDAFYARASRERKQKADRLRRQEDKERCLIAGALFQYGLEQFTGFNAQPDIRLGEMGKPHIPGLEFNLSHAGIYVAAAFGMKPVGIDVEGGRKPSEKIAARFHPEERSWYESGENVNNKNISRFYRLWTAKESVMKRDGRGITMGLDSFSVFSQPLKSEIHSQPLDGNYWLSLCSSEEWDEEIHWIERKNLLEVN